MKKLTVTIHTSAGLLEVNGYVPTADCPVAVTPDQGFEEDGPDARWVLTHRASGLTLNQLLPMGANRNSRAEMLAAAKAMAEAAPRMFELIARVPLGTTKPASHYLTKEEQAELQCWRGVAADAALSASIKHGSARYTVSGRRRAA